ncbi:hypothetical protein [Rossellomorea aquimaris]|uniref:hypothetical protein n=1 Tax=Rossellomorea TaxID=2837508 RepID=UPI001653EDB7|nr:hypothetical protein [Rossellomorea aquimaris]
MVNYKLKTHLLEVVDNPLNMNDPVCTRKTFNRLVAEGFEENETKEMIASVLTEEIFYMMKMKNTLIMNAMQKNCRCCRVILKDMMTGMQPLFRNL